MPKTHHSSCEIVGFGVCTCSFWIEQEQKVRYEAKVKAVGYCCNAPHHLRGRCDGCPRTVVDAAEGRPYSPPVVIGGYR